MSRLLNLEGNQFLTKKTSITCHSIIVENSKPGIRKTHYIGVDTIWLPAYLLFLDHVFLISK